MGYLLDTMTPERVDGQRDVVKNERRQSYENAPYGRRFSRCPSCSIRRTIRTAGRRSARWRICPPRATTTSCEFFKTYYVPNNASLVIAGDIDLAETRALVEKWFGEIPRGPSRAADCAAGRRCSTSVKKADDDRSVQLPRLYLAWHTPACSQPGDAAMDIASNLLTGGKNARLVSSGWSTTCRSRRT